jgi:hypothetical protein
MDTVTQYVVQYGLQALVAIGIFIAGVMASRWAGTFTQRSLERYALDPPVRHDCPPGTRCTDRAFGGGH